MIRLVWRKLSTHGGAGTHAAMLPRVLVIRVHQPFRLGFSEDTLAFLAE